MMPTMGRRSGSNGVAPLINSATALFAASFLSSADSSYGSGR